MERQTYTNTNRYLFLFLIALMVSCSKNDIQIAKSLNKEITIYPDYKLSLIHILTVRKGSRACDMSGLLFNPQK